MSRRWGASTAPPEPPTRPRSAGSGAPRSRTTGTRSPRPPRCASATLDQDARLFARLNLSLADGVIAFYDAKYTYRLWRPITATQAADTDGNPDTIGDPNWTPLVKTAPDPSYPGAHSVISTAAATTLRSFFGDRFGFSVTSEILPGVTRSFQSFSAAAEEAGRSRIFAGQHFAFDDTVGRRLGRQVGRYVRRHALR